MRRSRLSNPQAAEATIQAPGILLVAGVELHQGRMCLGLSQSSTLCSWLQGRIASGEDVFGPLIEKYLLANKHRVTVELLPDQQLAAKEDEAEKAELAAFKKKLVDSELQEVIKSTQQLKERQVSVLSYLHDVLFVPCRSGKPALLCRTYLLSGMQ